MGGGLGVGLGVDFNVGSVVTTFSFSAFSLSTFLFFKMSMSCPNPSMIKGLPAAGFLDFLVGRILDTKTLYVEE